MYFKSLAGFSKDTESVIAQCLTAFLGNMSTGLHKLLRSKSVVGFPVCLLKVIIYNICCVQITKRVNQNIFF